jgi:hypothetical protein
MLLADMHTITIGGGTFILKTLVDLGGVEELNASNWLG